MHLKCVGTLAYKLEWPPRLSGLLVCSSKRQRLIRDSRLTLLILLKQQTEKTKNISRTRLTEPYLS